VGGYGPLRPPSRLGALVPARPESVPPGPAARPRPAKLRWFTASRLPLTFAFAGLALIGFNRTRVGGWTVSDLLFVVCLALVVGQMLSGHPWGLAPPPARKGSPLVVIGSILLLTAGTMSAFNSWAPSRSFTIVLRFAWLTLAWFWLMRSVTADRRALDRLLLGWRVTLLVTAVLAVLGQVGVADWGVANAEDRQTAFMGHPNDLGGILGVGLPLIVLGLPEPAKRRRHPLVWRAAEVVLVSYALATSGSMSATIGALAGVAALGGLALALGRSTSRRASTPLVPMLVALGVAVGAVALFSSDLQVVDRFDRYESGDQGVGTSVGARGTSNQAVAAYFDRLLVVGVGFDSIDPEHPIDPSLVDAASAHNMYFRILFQAGLLGLFGLVMVLAFSFRQAWRLCVETRGDPLQPVCRVVFASAVAGSVFAAFQTTQYHRYYWLPFALISVIWGLRRHELRTAGPGPTGPARPGRAAR
jgi:O-antigen ligase